MLGSMERGVTIDSSRKSRGVREWVVEGGSKKGDRGTGGSWVKKKTPHLKAENAKSHSILVCALSAKPTSKSGLFGTTTAKGTLEKKGRSKIVQP